MFATNGMVLGNVAWDREIERRRAARINEIVAKYFDAAFSVDEPATDDEILVAFERALDADEYGDAEFLLSVS